MGRRNRKRRNKREVQKMEPTKETKSLTRTDLATKLVIREDVYRKVMFWVDKADTEVSGLGAIEIINGVPTVVDAILVDQECTGVETELDAGAICKAMYQYEKSGAPGEIRWWWHSHVNMDVFWSGTDYAAIEQIGSNGWFISTVFNKKRELRTAFYGTQPMNIFLDEIKTSIQTTVPQEIIMSWEAQFLAMVKKPKPVSYLGNYGGKYDYVTGRYSHPATQDLTLGEQTTLVKDEPQGAGEDYLSSFRLITADLSQSLQQQVYDLRVQGFPDWQIAENLKLEDNLIEDDEGLYMEDNAREIEELRRAGCTETDIYEMMNQKGNSHAI
jgi:hypothetical protein